MHQNVKCGIIGGAGGWSTGGEAPIGLYMQNWGKLELFRWRSCKNYTLKSFKPCAYNVYLWLIVPISQN